MNDDAGLPLGLIVALFLWEGLRFDDFGLFVPAVLGLIGIVGGLGVLPLERTSLREARKIYAWFLFVSAAVAYLDYEVMQAHGLWFTQRLQDDPGKYFEMAQGTGAFVPTNDPGFVLLLQYLWTLLTQFGQPHFLGVLNCVMVLSSVFAVCCMEVARLISPGARLVPYLFIFNPLVVALNASLLRDMLVGAVGWAAVLFGLALLGPERQSPKSAFISAVGFGVGCTVVYFLRTVSVAFFLVATLVVGASRLGRSGGINRGVLAIACLAAVYFGVVAGRPLLERSALFVDAAPVVVDNARASGSVASLVLDRLPGRVAIILGVTVVYTMPFWRLPSPLLVSETLINCCGSLFSQLFTSLSIIVGLVSILRRPSRVGIVMLLLYVGWCIAAAIMLQGHVRYVSSHLLPVTAAIGVHGWDVLGRQTKARRHMYQGLLLGAFLVLQVLIDLQKARL